MFFASLNYDFESICYSQQCTHMRTVTFKKKKENPRNRLDVVRQHKAECESVDL